MDARNKKKAKGTRAEGEGRLHNGGGLANTRIQNLIKKCRGVGTRNPTREGNSVPQQAGGRIQALDLLQARVVEAHALRGPATMLHDAVAGGPQHQKGDGAASPGPVSRDLLLRQIQAKALRCRSGGQRGIMNGAMLSGSRRRE